MYEIDLNLPKQIVADVLSNHEIHSVAFVGCGASMSDLYPAKYFLANNTDKLNVQIFTANEFNYDTPSWVNEHTVVIQDILDGMMPQMISLGLTGLMYWLIKKNVNTGWLLVIAIVGGIALSAAGILA